MEKDFIPIYQPDLSGKEESYVLECLRSTWISSKGHFISEFERNFSNYVGLHHATAVCNGTVALHLALVALGVGPGDEVIVPTLTYVASANAVAYTGAKPVFADSEPLWWQISPSDILAKLTPRTKAIMPVHLYGAPCDMDAIMTIARDHGLLVIEDCAEALGTLYTGRHGGTFGDIASFSLFGNKTITTGEGGMVVSNDPILYSRAVHFKGQGLAESRQYWHDVIGYNYRMTNVCAAIGLAQLERVGEFGIAKRRIAAGYRERLNGLGLAFHDEPPDGLHSHWMVSILVENAADRDRLRDWLADRNIETRPFFFPVHTMPMYSDKSESYKVAENLAERGINLPSWPGLNDLLLDRVCDEIRRFFKK